MFALPNEVESNRHEVVVRSARHSGGRLTPVSLPSSDDRALISVKKHVYEVPLSISRRFRDVQFKTLVGTAPMIPAAWYSVDDTLTIWGFETNATTTIKCDGIVTAVAVGLPSPGVFPPNLFQFLVCVVTENSVTLIGLSRDTLSQVNLEGYSVPIASPVTHVCIGLTGVVFLWNDQRNCSTIYELRYKSSASWFRGKLYMHYHSLMNTRATLSSVVWSIFSPNYSDTTMPTTVFMSPTVYRYFVTANASSVCLHEIVPSVTASAVATGAWRHSDDHEVKSIKCIGRMELTQYRVVDARVCLVDNNKPPIVYILTEFGDLQTLNSDMIVVQTIRVAAACNNKKIRTSFGSLPPSCCTIGKIAANRLVVCTQGGLSVTVSSDSEASTVLDVDGTVLEIATQVPVINDAYGAFALAENRQLPAVYVLTGKGVVSLETDTTTATEVKTVDDILQLLASPPTHLFTHKAVLVRELTDGNQRPTLGFEADFATKNGIVPPPSGAVWTEAVCEFFDSQTKIVRDQPVLVLINRAIVRVGIAQPVLENISNTLSNVAKFLKTVLGAVCLPAVQGSTCWARREFMHGHGSGPNYAKHISKLGKIASEMSRVSERVGFFGIVAEYQSTAVSDFGTDMMILTVSPRVLGNICERLLQINGGEYSLVDKLRRVCPSILCMVSPTAIVSFNAKGISAMLHCAFQQESSVNTLETVKALSRNMPSVNKSLNEIGPIIQSIDNPEWCISVIEAYMDGLGGRLMDESTVVLILTWAGSNLSRTLNECIFKFLFSRGYYHYVHEAKTNQFLEQWYAQLGSSMTIGESYAKFLVNTGRAKLASDVLEILANEAKCSLSDRIRLLEAANGVFSTSKRLVSCAIARYVQVPLLNAVSKARLSCELELEDQLIPLPTMFAWMKQKGDYPELELTSYMFSPVADSEIVKTWIRALFRDNVCIDTTLNELYSISVQIDSFDIWNKIDVIVALVEYIAVSNDDHIDCISFLQNRMKMNTTQIIELYMKILRESNKWISKVPKNCLAKIPTNQEIETHIVDLILGLTRKGIRDVERDRVVTLLILLKKYLKYDDDPLKIQGVIDTLSTHSSDAALPPA